MSKQEHKYKIDDRVIANFDGLPYQGIIVELRKNQYAKIMFDDGDLIEVKLVNLEPVQDSVLYNDDDESDVIDKSTNSNVGFNQYNIHWDDQKINFKFKAEGGSFYGWWRKTDIGKSTFRVTGYAIDIHVLLDGRSYNVDSIYYHDGDPRNDLHSLNGDICAGCNKWFYYKCNEDFDTIKSLQQKANKPTIFIDKLETLDRMILTLKDYRDTALKCGGERVLILENDDHVNNPTGGMRIHISLGRQAMTLIDKRVPSLFEGPMLDSVAEDNHKNAPRKGNLIKVANPKDVEMLQRQLKESKDPKEKRKIRGHLRKLGHKGGGRS